MEGFRPWLDNDPLDPHPWGIDSSIDSDEDGIPDLFDGPNGDWTGDVDGDGYQNNLDPDSDGDGLADGNNVTWTENDPQFDSWAETYHVSYCETDNIRLFYGEGWHGSDPWLNDTDYDGLWDGFNPVQTVPYNGYTRMGDTRFFVLNGRPYGDFRYYNISSLELKAYGELSYSSDPTNNDTDHDGLCDGEEVNGYNLYDTIKPKDDYVGGDWFSPWYPDFVIHKGSWARFSLVIDENFDGLSFVVSLEFGSANPKIEETGISVNISTGASLPVFDKHISHYDRGYGFYPYVTIGTSAAPMNYFYSLNMPVGILSMGIYSINISVPSDVQDTDIFGNISILCRKSFGSDPSSNDSDSDGLLDDMEMSLGSAILRNDTDRDGLLDGEDEWPVEWDADGDGLTFAREMYYGTDPLSADSDDDLLDDYKEIMVYCSDPLNANSDEDGIPDGIEVMPGEAVTLNSFSAINGVIEQIKSGGDTHPYFTKTQVSTDPTLTDSDGDGLDDSAELKLGTDPWNHDSDGDTILDMVDSDPTTMNTSGPMIQIKYYKPGGSNVVTITYRIQDTKGIVYSEFRVRGVPYYYESDSKVESPCEEDPNEIVVFHTVEYSLDIKSEYFRGPDFSVIAINSLGACTEASIKMSGALDSFETWVASGAVYVLGAGPGGFVTGFTSSFGDMMSGTWGMFIGIFDGTLLNMVGAAIAGISEKGFPNAIVGGAAEFYNGTANTIIAQQENCNPYKSSNDKSKHDDFANGYYAGYIIGFVVQMIICAKAGGAGKGAAEGAADGGVRASGAVIEQGLDEFVSTTGSSWSRISARFTEYAAKWQALRPGVRTVITLALTTSAFVGLKYAFPEIFDSWFKVGFGVAMTMDFVCDAAHAKLPEGDISTVRNLKQQFPLFKKDHPKVWQRVRSSEWSHPNYISFIEGTKNIIDANTMRPARFADLMDAYALRTGGRNLVDDLEAIPGFNKLSGKARNNVVELQACDRFGKNAAFDPKYSTADCSGALNTLLSKINDGTLDKISLESFINRFFGNVKSDEKGLNIAKGRAWQSKEMAQDVHPYNSQSGHSFKIDSRRIKHEGSFLEGDLEHIKPLSDGETKNHFEMIEYKNKNIGRDDINQLRRYINYANSEQARRDFFDKWIIKINTESCDMESSLYMEYHALANSCSYIKYIEY